MEAADYKALLEQAEEKLKAKTPGAYCSRKAAIRAMELLREAGQVQFSQLEKGVSSMTMLLESKAKQLLNALATIERQAQAIKQLNAEKTQTKLSPSVDKWDPYIPDKRDFLDSQERALQERALQELRKVVDKQIRERWDNMGPEFIDYPGRKGWLK